MRDQVNAATSPQSPAAQLRNAIAANDTSAIVAALAAGAPASPAVLKLAASNPQILAALPPSVAAAVSGQQTAPAQDTGARLAQEAVAETPDQAKTTQQPKAAAAITTKPAAMTAANKGGKPPSAAMNAALNAAKKSVRNTGGAVSGGQQQGDLPVSGGVKKQETPNKGNER